MELSARTIEERRFAASVNGYKKQDVEAFRAETAAYVSNLEEQLAIARTRAEKATRELTGMQERIEAELDEARAARARIIDEARAEAATIAEVSGRSEQQDAAHAAAIIQEAETAAHLRLSEVGSITDRAEAEADRIIAVAEEAATRREAEADRVLDEAHAEAHRLHTETQQYRAEMEANLAEIKRILDSTRASADAADVALDDGGNVVVDLRMEQEARTATEG